MCFDGGFINQRIKCILQKKRASQVAQWVKNLPAVQETQETRVRFLGWEDSLEDGMIAHPTILVQRIPWADAWWATVHRVAKSQTQLKQLSMHLEKKNHQMALFSIDGTILRTHTHTHTEKKKNLFQEINEYLVWL